MALAGAVFGACTRVQTSEPPPSIPISEAGAGGEPGGGSGALAGASGDGSGGDYVPAGGTPGSIGVGVWPTFAADPNQSDDVQAALAAISALSLGATTLPLAERWDALSSATGSPRSLTWQRLDAMTQPYRDRNGGIALCIGVVDRQAEAWPLADDLGSDAASAAIERTIDEVYTRYAAHLTHLCFGYEVDRYWAQA